MLVGANFTPLTSIRDPAPSVRDMPALHVGRIFSGNLCRSLIHRPPLYHVLDEVRSPFWLPLVMESVDEVSVQPLLPIILKGHFGHFHHPVMSGDYAACSELYHYQFALGVLRDSC
jgi:hypothetical protein